MRNSIRHFYEFGAFSLEVEKHRLMRDGEPVSLPPKAIEALLVLVRNPGKMLEREALMQAVWADTFVEDANLTVAISQLRKALGQKGETADYIETIPRVGYRFVAEVLERREQPAPLIIELLPLTRGTIITAANAATPGTITKSCRRCAVRLRATKAPIIVVDKTRDCTKCSGETLMMPFKTKTRFVMRRRSSRTSFS